MPMVEIVYVSDAELPAERVRAFADDVRRIFGDVAGTRPEQLRLTVQRVASADGVEEGA